MSLKVIENTRAGAAKVSGFGIRLSKSAQNLLAAGDVFDPRSSIPRTEDRDVQKQIRRRTTLLGLAIGTLLALLATGVARAQEVTEEFHQQYPMSANGSVTLKNVNGWVKISAWDQNTVKVDAVKRAWSKTRLDEARIIVEPEADSIYIRTAYPDREENECWGRNMSNAQRDDCRSAEVNYTVMVPRNAKLEHIASVNGSVEVTGVKGRANIEAVNGKVTVTNLSEDSEVSSVNGTVEASFDRLASSSKVHAVNGKLTVTIPSDANVRVRAHSLNGSISNDFGLPESRGWPVGHDLDGKLGEGAASLTIDTVNGRVEIRHANDGKPMASATSLLPRERTLAPY